jgi:hypothetical protein
LETDLTFTHVFGRCYIDTAYNVNDQLRFEYHGDGRTVKQQNHYVIDIRPANPRLKGIIHKHEVVRTHELEDGTKAMYGTMFRGQINALVFDKGGWLYWLWVDKRIEDKVTADVLVGIANSIGLGTKYKQKQLN